MMLLVILFLSSAALLNAEVVEEDLVLETPQGFLRGFQFKGENYSFYAFKGIRYGKRPRSFQSPEPSEPWEGIQDAKAPGSECIFFRLRDRKIVGNDDCLFLNVYIPQVPETSSPLPVIFFIHGGYFHFGGGYIGGPGYFMQEKVIFVSVNYRLGVFVSIMLLIVLVLLSSSSARADDYLIVATPQGYLRGLKIIINTTNHYYAFEGIRYGKHPKRFQVSEASDPWEGIKDATEPGPICLQMRPGSYDVLGEDDCLFLNVYIPQAPNTVTSNAAIIFYVHGSCFHTGQIATIGSPDKFMEENLIFVSVFYRLGVQGFLCLQDDVVPGNAGLKDVLLALHWVRNNIASFGGDPGKITAMGHSAGAAIAHLLLLSPLTRGLLNGAVSLSGVAISPWAFSRQPRVDAHLLAEVYQCNRSSSSEILACLEKVDVKELTATQYNAWSMAHINVGLGIFLPCIEAKSDDAFIYEDPFTMLKKGDEDNKPHIVGTASREAALFETVLTSPIVPKNLKFELMQLLDKLEPFKMPPPYSLSQNAINRVKEFYFNSERVTASNIGAMVNLSSDLWALLPTIDTINLKIRRPGTPIYQFYLTYDSDYSYEKKVLPLPSTGPGHSDIMGYIFQYDNVNFENDDCALMISTQLVKAFATFAKFGDPTPDDSLGFRWPTAQTDKMNYLEVDQNFEIRTNAEAERMQFWTDLRKEENFDLYQ